MRNSETLIGRMRGNSSVLCGIDTADLLALPISVKERKPRRRIVQRPLLPIGVDASRAPKLLNPEHRPRYSEEDLE